MKVQGGLRRFLHAHYVCTVVVLASYIPLRRLMSEPAAVEGVSARLFAYVRARAARFGTLRRTLLTCAVSAAQERQAFIMMVVSFGLKVRVYGARG
jgi:hypothetical protein